MKKLDASGVPIVFIINSYYRELDAPISVLMEDREGGRQAVRYLIDRGYRNIGGIFKKRRYAGCGTICRIQPRTYRRRPADSRRSGRLVYDGIETDDSGAKPRRLSWNVFAAATRCFATMTRLRQTDRYPCAPQKISVPDGMAVRGALTTAALQNLSYRRSLPCFTPKRRWALLPQSCCR